MRESMESEYIYRFGRFSLDPGERLLLCEAERVNLTPRAFDLLVVLAENPGRLLDKRLLLERVWGGTFVEEANLSNNISLLRKVLAARGEEVRYIETVPRRGYRFVAPVTKLPPAVHAPMSVPGTPAPDPAVTPSRAIVTRLLGAAAGVTLAAGACWFLFARFGPRDSVPFAGEAIARLTHTGRATHATVSADGRYVAYVERSPDGPSLWVRHLGAADSVQLVPPTQRQYVGLTFSPDGSSIYYVVREAPLVTEGALYKVRIQGGPARRMLTRISSPVSFAPGGAEFAYLRVPQAAPGSLMVATFDTAREDVAAIRILAEGRFPFVSGVAWSPDGSVIATVQGPQSTGGGGVRLVAVRVDDGRLLAMSEGHWRRVTRLAWLSDGGGLMINAEEQLDVGQIWHVSYPSGTSQRATVDASTDNAGLTLTEDSRMLVTIHEDHTSTIWVKDDADTRARQITFGKYDGRFGVQWTPDERIVYSSMESGNDDIWLMNADGSSRRQLTTHPAVDDKPSVSADGRYVLFNSDRAGAFDLWRMDIDGGNQTRLTSGIRIRAHQSSDHARFAVASGNARLWKVSIDDGDPEPLSDAIAFSPAVSSDGQFVAACWRADRRSPPRLAVFPASGGQPLSVFNADCHPFDNGAIRWSVDDRDITYAWDGRLWAQARDGGQPRLHPSVAYQDVLQFDWSASGRLVLARGDRSGDVVIMRR